MPKPNKLAKLPVVDMDPVFQQHYSQVIDTLNTLAGYNGEIELSDHLNMGGKRVKNLGEAVDETDALPVLTAQKKYSAAALKPQFQSGGTQPLSTYRILNSPSQREQQSSYLNDLMSAPPNANTLVPTITPSGGGVSVSLPASIFKFADGSLVNLVGRTDLLSLPGQFAIISISCVGNLVTVNCAPSGLVAGQVMTITGVVPASFNGTFTILSSTGGGSVLTYQLDLGTVAGAGGFVQTNGVYYYAVTKRQVHLTLLGPFSGDTLQNRLNANFDGFQIVAVVVLTSSGGQVGQSGGGGSPIVGSPTAGSFF